MRWLDNRFVVLDTAIDRHPSGEVSYRLAITLVTLCVLQVKLTRDGRAGGSR